MNVKEYFQGFMDKIQKQNPDANWTNLLTGLGVVALVVIFSFWYFNRNLDAQFTPVDGDVQGETEKAVDAENTDASDSGQENLEGEGSGESMDSANGNESANAQNVQQGKTTTVLPGEGLYQVAQRVCGDAERYNYLADANNLNIYSNVAAGQELVVECGLK